MGLGAIFGGIGLAGSLFGIGKQGYGAADNAYNTGTGLLNQETPIANAYNGIGQAAMGNYNTAEGNVNGGNGSYNQLRDTYQSNPYATDQGGSSFVNQYLGNMNKAYTGAGNAYTAALASRGFTGPSSMLAGGLAGIEQGHAANLGQAYGALNQQAINRDTSNAQNLYGLDTGQAQNQYNTGSNAYGQQVGILNNQANSDFNRAQGLTQRTDAANQATQGAWTGLAGLGGSLYGQQQAAQMYGGNGGYGFGNGGGGGGDYNPAMNWLQTGQWG